MCSAGADDHTDVLEVPWMASVTGLAAGPPQPACISSFGQTVHVFASKQRPIKMTIHGSDFRCARSEDGVQHACCMIQGPGALLLQKGHTGSQRISISLAHSSYGVNRQAVWL